MGKLLSNFGKRGVDYSLFTMKVDIDDTTYLSSKYFVVSEFNPVFTAGRNALAFNGSSLLKANSEIKIQCIDSNNNSLYIESPRSKTQFVDIANFIVSIHVYDEIYNGTGKIALVATSSKGEIIRWVSNITIDKTLQNVSNTRFYNTPTIEARSLLYPIISNDISSDLTQHIILTGSFYSFAVIPKQDTFQSYINPKKTDIDYRLVYNNIDINTVDFGLNPTMSFNSQMEGQYIDINAYTIQTPLTYNNKDVNISSSFLIKKVLNNTTLILSNPVFYPSGKDNVVININSGGFTSSYTWVAYNTQADKYQTFGPSNQYAKKSYAEITYRNIKPFIGFVARHKLYRKSLLRPGDFELIVDEPFGTKELLIDPITDNKSYNLMGTFYNQNHINKYWFPNSKELQLSHSIYPRINSMIIAPASESYSNIDGSKYVIIKTDSVYDNLIPNDSIYRAYNEIEFNNLQGNSYNSNFIDLKEGSLYSLSLNLTVNKEKYDTSAKIEFYFTSSVSSIQSELNYISPYGLKLGEIPIVDIVSTKIFSDKQVLYFTPSNDYYGTLVIVPYKCSPIISELSLGVYNDYGFSPDTLTTKIPFSVNVANEAFLIKSELFDINSSLIYSNLNTIQTFDVDGISLASILTSDSTSKTVTKKRLTAWSEDTPGTMYYTNIVDATLIPTNNAGTVQSKDYISLTTTDDSSNVYNGQALVVYYSGSAGGGDSSAGRKIVIAEDGTKTIYT